MVSDADRLLARGSSITLQSQALRVHFGFASLRYLEKEYGGLDVFWSKLGEAGFGATRVETIFHGMVAGLLETKPDEQDFEDFEREIEAKLEPSDLLKYLEAVVRAFGESIPSFENGSAPKAKGSRGNSHGRGSTGTPRSTSAAQIASSGA